jgi:hypothetical protein
MRRPQNCRRVPEHVHLSVCASSEQIADEPAPDNRPSGSLLGKNSNVRARHLRLVSTVQRRLVGSYFQSR